jgi:Ca2+-binding RTX toxin-like protein
MYLRKPATAGAAVAAVLLSLSFAGVAYSNPPTGTVSVENGDTVTYVAASGQNNKITISTSGSDIIVEDVYLLTAGPGCVSVDPATVRCDSAGIDLVKVYAGDKDDSITKTSPHSSYLYGGDGKDTISAGPATIAHGAVAANYLYGEDGDDSLTGGPDDDTLNGGGGADTFVGGTGSDTVSYDGATADVSIDNDGVSGDDGAPGEGDTIGTDVENLTGGYGDDTIRGASSANTLQGGPGDDILDGGLGADILYGGSGEDAVTYAGRMQNITADLDGSVGDDGAQGEGDTIASDVEDLIGGYGNDVLTGNAGDNYIYGGTELHLCTGSFPNYTCFGGGEDTLKGGAGDDVLDGGYSSDIIDGGPDNDWVDYSSRVAPVHVYLDGVANDGQSGENDDLHSIENIKGGAGDDYLFGNIAGNEIWGNGGVDHIYGKGGDDMLYGGAGPNDWVDDGDTADGGSDYDVCWFFTAPKHCESTDHMPHFPPY